MFEDVALFITLESKAWKSGGRLHTLRWRLMECGLSHREHIESRAQVEPRDHVGSRQHVESRE